jgi:SpoVK/Ycf46/Vps4 family AAA+-type ATPase
MNFNFPSTCAQVLSICETRPSLVQDIFSFLESGGRKFLLVGPSGSGKSHLARALLTPFFPDFTLISQSDGYGISEPYSLHSLRMKFETSSSILVEEISNFSMILTPRDRRLTKVLSILLTSDKIIVGTVRLLTSIDPCLLTSFEKIFFLQPPDLDGRFSFMKSLPEDLESEFIQQFRALNDQESQRDLLKQYAGLQPSELLSAKSYHPSSSLNSVAGVSLILSRLHFLIVEPFVNPQIFQRIGVKPPRGILLTGPSGCGKTLIARSIGESSRVSFFDIVGVEIIAKEVGQSEKQLHEIFERARAASPSIILFDDIDSIAPKRTFETSVAGDRLLTTLLVEMDGLLGSDDGVVIVATTNRPQALDPALTRPGRFDYIFDIPIPDADARGEIFDLHTKQMPLENAVRSREIVVRATENLAGAMIEGIVREAAMVAIRKDINSLVIPVEAFVEAIGISKAVVQPRQSTKKRVYKF